MPKINVYLPDDLAVEVKQSGVPVSAICQQALADAVAASQMAPGAATSTTLHDDDLAKNFTKRAYNVITSAQGSTGQATTVDLVRALVDSGGLALSVLQAADIEPRDLLDELVAREARGATAGDLESVTERAVDQARGLETTYVGTEHLLLGLTSGPARELAASTLSDMGLSHENALRGVTTALAAYSYARESLTFSGISAPIRAALEDIRSRLVRLEERRADRA